jgi:diguanylate cyclase (GGDEF)-like protein
LREALDEIDVGVVLLDKKFKSQFINRAFPRLWRLSSCEKLEGRNFGDLVRITLEHRLAPMSVAELDAIVENRVGLLRAGATKPRDLKLADGQVIRVNCKPMPNGSRMMVYTDVTDLFELTNQLEELATTDSLTGLFNRRHFFSQAEVEWSRYRRYPRPMSLLMIDVDQLKLINDSHGHDVGDRVLAEVAQLCGKHKRKSDVAARLGGDEFVILLPETPLQAAVAAADRLRTETEQHPFLVGLCSGGATVSIGAAEANPGMESILDLMKSADRAVYTAKARGRNRVCTAEPA